MDQERSKGKYQSLKNLTSPEKRKWRRDQKQKYEATRVRLGEQSKRWGDAKKKLGLKSDAEFAKFLLDRYESSMFGMLSPLRSTATTSQQMEGIGMKELPHQSTGEQMHMTSTPASSHAVREEAPGIPGVSGQDMDFDFTEEGDFIIPHDTPGSFDRDSDPDWDSSEADSSSSDISAEFSMDEPEQPDLDAVLNFDTTDTDHSDEDDTDEGTGSETCARDHLFITYKESLMQLLVHCRPRCCVRQSCKSPPEESVKFVGTAAVVTWICDKGHVSMTWRSQPKLKGNNAGDLAVSAAIILSGNNYAKIKMMLTFMNMGMSHVALHNYCQRTYTFPAIEEHWNGLQTELLRTRKGTSIVVSGDGRNDSPGHSAQYCTYTVMDYDTSDILDVQVIDKRETELKSVNMEKVGLVRALGHLANNDVKVEEVVTDTHPQIKAYIKGLEGTFHSCDVWHGAKNIGKKVAKKAKCRPLLPWIGEVTKHFWYCSQQANGSVDLFLANWRGILHHVVGQHEWALGDGVGPARCQHGPLPAESSQKNLEPGTPAHTALREIVLDVNLMRNAPYYTKFRHTSALENFQSHVLVYAAKRFAYGPPSYRSRNLLAAIDYQHHEGRQQMQRHGEPAFTRNYSKSAERWTCVPVMEKKTYSYIPQLMEDIFRRRLADQQSQRTRVVLAEHDPRRISGTIRPTQPPNVAQLVASHQSRMGPGPSSSQ